MFALLMACSALVIAAAALGGLALLISRFAASARGWDSRLLKIAENMRTSTPSAFRAELDDLRAALDVIRASNRREFGSLWARVGAEKRESSSGVQKPDADLETLLEFQARPPAGP